MTQPTSSAGTQEAASMAAVRLLREIVDYQQRLRRLREHEAAGDQTYLISAYQRAMTLRRELLDDLYKPPESVPSPFDPNASFDPTPRSTRTPRPTRTPSGLPMSDPPDLLPAGLLRRLGAMLYDALLVVALAMLTMYPLMVITDGNLSRPTVQSLVFIESFCFFAFFWVRRGQTAGMLAWRLRVQSLDGRGLTLRQALLRFIGATLSFAALGVGYLWMLIDPGRRTWSDMLSGTEVFHVTPGPRTPRQSPPG